MLALGIQPVGYKGTHRLEETEAQVRFADINTDTTICKYRQGGEKKITLLECSWLAKLNTETHRSTHMCTHAFTPTCRGRVFNYSILVMTILLLRNRLAHYHYHIHMVTAVLSLQITVLVLIILPVFIYLLKYHCESVTGLHNDSTHTSCRTLL